MNNIPNINQLQPFFDKEKYIKLLLKQLSVEFNKFNVRFSIDFNRLKSSQDITLFYKLHNLLLPTLSQLIENNPEKLKQLFYSIDISEEKWFSELKNKPQIDEDIVITELILKRVLQKVVIKDLLSK